VDACTHRPIGAETGFDLVKAQKALAVKFERLLAPNN